MSLNIESVDTYFMYFGSCYSEKHFEIKIQSTQSSPCEMSELCLLGVRMRKYLCTVLYFEWHDIIHTYEQNRTCANGFAKSLSDICSLFGQLSFMSSDNKSHSFVCITKPLSPLPTCHSSIYWSQPVKGKRFLLFHPCCSTCSHQQQKSSILFYNTSDSINHFQFISIANTVYQKE